MLNAFEERLIDLLADAVSGSPPQGQPRIEVLARVGAAAAAATDVAVSAQLGEATGWSDFGDDGQVARKIEAGWRLRTEIPLNGEVAVSLVAQSGTPVERRARLLNALDRMLVVLDAEALRHGTGFDPGQDRGFAISGFRLLRVDANNDKPPDPTRMTLVYGYQGRFWPVVAEVEGPQIRTLPTRFAILPLAVPERLSTRAGNGALAIDIRADLRGLEGGSPVLMAKLRGLAPGVLEGTGLPAPQGFVGSAADTSGRFPLSYRPPAAVAGPIDVGIQLSLASSAGATVVLDDLTVKVLPQ